MEVCGLSVGWKAGGGPLGDGLREGLVRNRFFNFISCRRLYADFELDLY